MEASFSFGSVSGATFAFWFFLAFSVAIGVMCGALARGLGRRHTWLAGRGGGGWQSVLLGVVVFATAFSAIYLTTIDGFYQMTVESDRVILNYVLPQRAVVVSRTDLAEVRTEVGPKNNWHLNLYRQNGYRLSSAQAAYPEVREAQKFLERYIAERK